MKTSHVSGSAVVFTAIMLVVAVAVGQDSVKTTAAEEEPAVKTVVPDGKLYDFESELPVLQQGWVVVTDTIMNGNSTGEAVIAREGAAGSKQSLKVSGTVKSDNPFIMFSGVASRFGGNEPLYYDVTTFTGIHFWARGDGNTYSIQLPMGAIKDYMYYSFAFTPPEGEWKEYKVPFKGFKQQPYGKKVPWTGTDIMGVQFFTVGGPLESFALQVDEIEFYKTEE